MEALSDKYVGFSGHIKGWLVADDGSSQRKVIDQPNLITYQGSDILATCLAGAQNSKISHMYIGFHNGASFTAPTPQKTDTRDTFQNISGFDPDMGYLRIPLSLTPSYFNNTNYVKNNVVFTTTVTNLTEEAGAAFTPDTSYIYEAALVSAGSTSTTEEDRVFSRATFTPTLFVSNYNLVLSWAIQFLS